VDKMSEITSVDIILNYNKVLNEILPQHKKGTIPDDMRESIIKDVVYGFLYDKNNKDDPDKIDKLLKKLLSINKKFINPYPSEDITKISAPFLLEFDEINRKITKQKVVEGNKAEKNISPTQEMNLEARKETDVYKEAIRVLTECDIVEYNLKQFRTIHTGDEILLKIFLMMYCSQHTENIDVIQPKISGVYGAGKSSGSESAIKMFPEEFLYQGSWSPMSLFDTQDGKDPVKRGMIIYSDDKVPTLEQQAIIKVATSRSHEINYHKTVLSGGERKMLIIPQELVFIFTSVEDVMDSAFLNRYMTINIEKNSELDNEYTKFLNNQFDSPENAKKKITVTKEMEVCKEIIRIIKQNRYIVWVPFSKRIEFTSIENRRAQNQFYSIMCSHAVLNYMKRRCHMNDDGIIEVEAIKDDFDFANEIFPKNQLQRDYKLTPVLMETLTEIQKYRSVDDAVNQSTLAKNLDISETAISRRLIGNVSEGVGGLTSVPGVTSVKDPYKNLPEFQYPVCCRGMYWYWNKDSVDGISNYSNFAILKPEDAQVRVAELRPTASLNASLS
jgi:hypothetical protein